MPVRPWPPSSSCWMKSPEAVDGFSVPPQTNAVGRSPALASGLLVIACYTAMPIRLREIGSSGGLNLRLDSYWYEQDGEGWGETRSHLCGSANLWKGGTPNFSGGSETSFQIGADVTGIRSMRPARRAP